MFRNSALESIVLKNKKDTRRPVNGCSDQKDPDSHRKARFSKINKRLIQIS